MLTLSISGRVLLALALLAAGVPLLAQSFSDTTSTVVVEVPVQVIRDGQPVRGLTAADFQVFDGRKKQQIVGFEVIDLAASETQTPKGMPIAGRRHFLILFDMAFSDPVRLVKARVAAAGIVEELHPSDLVGVAVYSSRRGAELVLGFTADRAQIASAIDTLGARELFDRNPDPLRLMLGHTRGADDIMGNTGGGDSPAAGARADADAEMTTLLESMARNSNEVTDTANQAAVRSLTRSLADFSRVMGAVPGRKYVVYLSEGFDPGLLEGATSVEERADLAASTQEGEYWNASSTEMFGDSRTLNEVEKMLEELRRNDCVVQAVDIGGLRADAELGNRLPSGKESLLNFAKSTGGELYENFNNLDQAMGEMLARTSVTYVLAFQPEQLEWDGSFHRLKVELVNQARGTRLVHRPGFYAPRPYTEKSPMERIVDASSQVVAGEDSGSLDMAVLTAPFAMPGQQKAYVPVVIEVNGKTLLDGHSAAALPAELYVYAFDSATGQVADYVTQTMGLDLAKTRPALEQSGFKFFGHLELPPGDYTVRALIRNGATGASGLRVVPVRVPAFASSEPALLPPFFPEPPNSWLLAREAPRGDFKQAPYPFMQGQTPYVPASRPVLVPGQEVAVALVGYHLPASGAKLEARVLSADGKEVGTAPLSVTGQENGTPVRLAATFKPPQLSPGDYRIEIRLAGDHGAPPVAATAVRVGKGR